MAHDEVHPAVVAAPAPSPPPQIIIQQQLERRSAASASGCSPRSCIAVMFIIGLYSSYHSYFSPADAPQEKYHSLATFATKKIAIIDVSGAIMEGEDSFAKKQIDRVREDTDVVGVVLRINSPGGTVTGSDYLYHHLRELVEEAQAAARRQHGQRLRERRLLHRDGRRRPAGLDLRRADDLDRLDRRDHSAFRPVRRTRQARHHGRFDRQRPAQADGLAHPADDRGGAQDAASAGRRELQGFQRRSSSAAGRSSRTTTAALDAVTTGQIFTAKQALEHGPGRQDRLRRGGDRPGRPSWPAKTPRTVRCVKYEKPPTLFGALVGADSRMRRPRPRRRCRPPRPGVARERTTSGRGCRRRCRTRNEFYHRGTEFTEITECNCKAEHWN